LTALTLSCGKSAITSLNSFAAREYNSYYEKKLF
jgi:hypothetical protein